MGVIFERKLQKSKSGSYFVILPHEVVRAKQIEPGDVLELEVNGDILVRKKLKKKA